MKSKILLLATLAVISGTAQAKNHSDVTKLMQTYLSTITCWVEEDKGFDIFDISAFDGQTNTFGVAWTGDKGCDGGRSITSYITPVRVTRWGELLISNENEIKLPTQYKRISFENNIIAVTTSMYLDDDPGCCPTGEEQHLYFYDESSGEFQLQK